MAKENIWKRKNPNGASNRGHKKGQGALKAGTALKHSNASSKPFRTTPNGETRVKGFSNNRSESTIKRLQMYTKKPNMQKMREQPSGPCRIQPDRRWFGNTRVITQEKMQAFRETIAKGVEDPYSVVLKSSKLPMSLLHEAEGKASRMNLLSISPYSEVFSGKRRQKRVKLGNYDMEGLLASVEKKNDSYNDGQRDTMAHIDPATGFEKDEDDVTKLSHKSEEIFNKGTSKRIWAELYKVVDSADVLVEVLDARDPMGTRCAQLEQEIRKNRPNKHIILVLNKVDLVPTWVSRRWIQVLMKDFPTLAFHASISNPFGKNSLLNLLKQFSQLLKEKKHVTVGMIGYPNVGKSSVINTLRKKKVCKAAPVPGETRVWQYIALTKRLYLLDCPGIVPPTSNDFSADCAKLLKGVVRAERVETPSNYIDEVLNRVKKPYLLQKYKLPADTTWENGEEFLTILATKMGKLFKGGDPDLDIAARIVLYDWQRGRIPFFTPPPELDKSEDKTETTPAAASTSAVAPASQSGDEKSEEEVKALEDGSAADPGKQVEEDPAQRGDKETNKSISNALAAAANHASRLSMSDLTCALNFDEEDQRGDGAEEALETGTSAAQSDETRGAKRRLQASGDGPRKKNRKRGQAESSGRGNANRDGAAASSSGDGRAAASLKPGSVDWNAVVAEFGM